MALLVDGDQQLLIILAAARLLQSDFDGTLDRRQRRPEFVGGVGEKFAVLRQVIGDLIQKLVDLVRQLVQFVIDAANRQPLFQMARPAAVRWW